MRRVCNAITFLVLAATGGVGCAMESKVTSDRSTGDHSAPFIGCWQGEGVKPFLLRCEPTRVSWFDPREAKPNACLAKYDAGHILLFMGRWVPFVSEARGSNLVWAGKTMLHRIDVVPEELSFRPVQLGTTRMVPAAELESIKKDLQKRFDADQSVRSNPLSSILPGIAADSQKMRESDADNTQYLRNVVSKYGWIDQERFGADTSLYAWAIVQHSGDIPFMLGVLPQIEKDLRKEPGGFNVMSYAFLYDRVMIMTGRKQRYGTQSGENDKGESFTWPIEDPEKVKEEWAAIGGKLGSDDGKPHDAEQETPSKDK